MVVIESVVVLIEVPHEVAALAVDLEVVSVAEADAMLLTIENQVVSVVEDKVAVAVLAAAEWAIDSIMIVSEAAEAVVAEVLLTHSRLKASAIGLLLF